MKTYSVKIPGHLHQVYKSQGVKAGKEMAKNEHFLKITTKMEAVA